MENNIDSSNNTVPINRNLYTDCKGTGVFSTLIFAICVILLMMFIAHFKGS